MSDNHPHRFDPTILREYDIRGVVGETLHVADALAIGRSFGTIVAEGGGKAVAVGYDGRLSSPALEEAAVEGLAASGLEVLRVGRGPTPMLYYAAVTLPVDAGLQVTGSHNPPSHNGFKIMLGRKPFYGAEIQRIGRLAAEGAWRRAAGSVRDVAVFDDYVGRLARDYDGTRPLTVVWDAGNGAAGEALVALTRRLPGRHILLNETIDGNFPAHHPDPTEPHNLVQLQAKVHETAADLGIAFDGDGDRIGVVDGRGRILWGDQLLTILAQDVLRQHPGATIIADVKASQVLFDQIEAMGGVPLMWRTGHSLIKTKMAELGAPLAGEMSGHIFFADKWYGFDDALYAAVRLLGILGRSALSIDAMRDRLPAVINTPELRFPCRDTRKFAVIDEVKARLEAAGATVSAVDGVRVNTADGWWLLRASNTQAVLVARAEASSEAGLERLKAALAAQLQASGLAAPDFSGAQAGH
jgi:phosphomannomutase